MGRKTVVFTTGILNNSSKSDTSDRTVSHVLNECGQPKPGTTEGRRVPTCCYRPMARFKKADDGQPNLLNTFSCFSGPAVLCLQLFTHWEFVFCLGYWCLAVPVTVTICAAKSWSSLPGRTVQRSIPHGVGYCRLVTIPSFVHRLLWEIALVPKEPLPHLLSIPSLIASWAWGDEWD